MKIEDISIFGEYSQSENRVTAALLQILKIGGENLIRHVMTKVGIQLPDSEISIETQVKETQGAKDHSKKRSVPDGLLSSNFAFRIFIESKIIKNKIDVNQLQTHKNKLVNKTDYLIYITPDEIKPSLLGDTAWINWNTINQELEDFITEEGELKTNNNMELLSFLIKHFTTLIDRLNLIEEKWIPDEDRVLIVAASWAESIALKYNFYACQERRSFKPSRYIAFYNNNRISYLFKVLEAPKESVELNKVDIIKTSDYLTVDDSNYDNGKRKVFILEKVKELEDPILNDSRDKNDNLCPYTYGQPRYTTIDKFNRAKYTSNLK